MLAGCARVVLVLDVADEFFDDVLERDHAGRTAVLVDDDRHLRRVGTQVGKHHSEPRCLRNREDLACQRIHSYLVVGRSVNAEQVLGMDDPGDLTVVVDDGEARVGRRHQVTQVRSAGGCLDRDHTVPRHHCIRCVQLPEVDRPFEQSGLQGRQVSTLCRRVDNQVQFLVRHDFVQLLERLDADETEEPPRRSVEQPDQWTGHAQEEPRRRRERTHERFWSRNRKVLRDQLAEHRLGDRDDDEREREREPGPDSVRDTDCLKRRSNDHTERRLGDETEYECGHRDAELHARHHEAEPLVDLNGPLRSPIAFAGPYGEPGPARRDEGELDRHEVAGCGDQRHNTDQSECSQHCSTSFWISGHGQTDHISYRVVAWGGSSSPTSTLRSCVLGNYTSERNEATGGT